MKLVLNRNWGGFHLPKEFCELYDCSAYDDIERNDSRLVSFIENKGGKFGDLKIVEIPDDNTDYRIDDYDGMETVTYVVGGKMYDA